MNIKHLSLIALLFNASMPIVAAEQNQTQNQNTNTEKKTLSKKAKIGIGIVAAAVVAYAIKKLCFAHDPEKELFEQLRGYRALVAPEMIQEIIRNDGNKRNEQMFTAEQRQRLQQKIDALNQANPNRPDLAQAQAELQRLRDQDPSVNAALDIAFTEFFLISVQEDRRDEAKHQARLAELRNSNGI